MRVSLYPATQLIVGRAYSTQDGTPLGKLLKRKGNQLTFEKLKDTFDPGFFFREVGKVPRFMKTRRRRAGPELS